MRVSEQVATQLDGTINQKNWGDAFYNALVHDIRPDGTDATNKLQALVDLANQEGRRTIYFPKGKYKVTQLSNASNIVFLGDNASFVGGYKGAISQIGESPNESTDLSSVISRMISGQPVKIVCYGDSITFGYKVGSGAQVANPYPTELQANLRKIYNNNNITVVNKGTTGWRSTEALNNVQSAIDQAPDVCIVMFGINDCKGSSWGPSISVSEYKQNMEKVIQRLNAEGRQVIICTNTPYLTDFQRIVPYEDAARSLSKSYNLGLVDMALEVGKIFDEKFIAPINLLPDEIHFGDQFYKYVAHIILKKFFKFPEAKAGKSYPAVQSPYVPNDCNVVFPDPGQFFVRNYILRGVAGPSTGTSIRIPIFLDKKGLKFFIIHPKAPTGTTMNITLNGNHSAQLDSYNTVFIFDIETQIATMDFGLNLFEMNYLNSNQSGPGGGNNNFIAGFTFKE